MEMDRGTEGVGGKVREREREGGRIWKGEAEGREKGERQCVSLFEFL